MIFEIIKQLAKTDSTKEKEAILRAHENNETLARVFKMTYSKRYTYGITRVPDASAGMGIYTLEQALDILEQQFVTRQVSGNRAIEMLNSVCNALTHDDFQVLRRLIKRDLECGAGVSIPNKVWPGLVPEQPCFLSASFSEKNLKNIKYPAYAQLKADGARCMALIDELGNVSLTSRAGNEYLGLTNVVAQLKALGVTNVMIDGELIHKPKKKAFDIFALDEEDVDDDLAEAQEEIESDRNKSNGLSNKALNGSLSNAEQEEMVFNVWDIVDLDVYWGRKPSNEIYDVRFGKLIDIVGTQYANIELIESKIVNSYEEALALYRHYVEQGREGIILKNKHGLWADARTTDQIKFKEEIEIDLVVVDIYPHKKDPNKLGGITVEDRSGRIRCNCGSGFKDKTHDKDKATKKKVLIPLHHRHEYDRELLWSQRFDLLGSIVQLKCNGLQTSKGRKSKDGKAEFKLFLPIFQLIRRDKSIANDITEVFDVK